MASEAQRLIGISLTKIAQSRSHRGGVSLHKNLLVATVLQKARYIFMEEAYNMHYQPHTPVIHPRPAPVDLVGLTAEEAGLDQSPSSPEEVQESSSSSASSNSSDLLPCVKCAENQANQDKENHPPYYSSELTYFDLDKSSNVLRERSNSPSLKRRRAVAEWETEEAVQSILPKRSRSDDESSEVSADDSVFLDDATLLSEAVSKEVEAAAERTQESQTTTPQSSCSGGSSMEIDRITSLVSIFSFSMGDSSKLNRSVSTPDLCSAQAKETPDSIQQRQFLAMTV